MKKRANFFTKTLNGLAAMGIILLFLVACNVKKDLGSLTTADLNITSYLEAHPDQFSEFLKLLNTEVTISNGSTIKYASFLGAYGTYTLFAPTNEAIQKYLQEKNIPSVADMSSDDVKNLLNIHILQDTISTSKFTDGKLRVPTMYGQYLVTVASYNGQVSRILVNKQGYIIQKDISLGNGVVHVIDGVLQPAKNTLAKLVENDTRFSIFTQALKETGYYDTINTVTDPDPFKRRWLSVMAEPDSIYQTIGINNYAALKAKYCTTGDPLNIADSLHLYVGYHILDGLKFVADLVSASSHNTLIPNQVINVNVDGNIVVINEVTINGVLEPGVPMNRFISDISATNGVMHVMAGNYYIKIRKMMPLYFDLCDYPELRTMAPGGWGVPQGGGPYYITSGQVKGITFSAVYPTADVYYATTTYSAPTATAIRYIYYNTMAVRFRSTSGCKWIKFTTPFMTAGKYKVWLSWRRAGNPGITVQASVDSTDLPIIIDMSDYLPDRGSRTLEEWDNYLQGIGYKKEWQTRGNINESYHVLNCRYLGIAELKTSGTHWIKFTALANGVASYYSLDQVHFIPLDEDQIWPKFDEDGTALPRPPSPYNDTPTPLY
jgi:uncharacterized surface protein with fasciclin (FAS1) repeats